MTAIGAPGLTLKEGDLDDDRVVALLTSHAERARLETGQGSAHALDPEAFRAADIQLWTAWSGETLLGVGAWKRLDAVHGEVKSFHTIEAARGRGVAGLLLRRIVETARAEGVRRLSLETGSWPYFAPARSFYAGHGFEICGPFGAYAEDANSVFMTREL